jgi:hypothetical protein
MSRSRNGYVNPAYLDLNDEDIIHALIALDTELNSLHRLCMEQGPFFKCTFEEISSDALRQGLKQNLRGQPANQSHSERSYWKPEIKITQIKTIEDTVTDFSLRWNKFYIRHQKKRFYPKTLESTSSPMTQLNYTFESLTENIILICQYLTTPHDAKNTSEPVKIDPKETATYHKNRRMYRKVNECMTWIELNTDDKAEHARIATEHSDLRTKIWGPFESFGRPYSSPAWFEIEQLPLVIAFRDKMQQVIDAKTHKDTALYRAGMELIGDLTNLILEFQTDEPTYDPPEVVQQKTETNSALSSLLAQLTNGA